MVGHFPYKEEMGVRFPSGLLGDYMTLFKFDGFIYTNEFNFKFPGYKKKGKYDGAMA